MIGKLCMSRNEERAKAYRKKYSNNNRELISARGKQYYIENRERLRLYAKKYAEERPEVPKNYRLKRDYGITLEQWSKLFLGQGSCCAVCSADNPGSKHGWATDHCHKTKKIRGVLCVGCNIALGGAKDNIQTLRSLITYLEQSTS